MGSGSVGPARSAQQVLARLVGSARPAAQQAGSGRWAGCVRGPARPTGQCGLRVNVGASSWALLLLGPRRLAACLLLLFVPLTGRSHLSASVGSGAAACGSSAAGKGVCVRVRKPQVCAHRRTLSVREKTPKGWPRRERDVAAVAHGHRAQQGHGGIVAWRRRRGKGGQKQARLCRSVRGCACARYGEGEASSGAAKQGQGLASRRWCACTRAGPGFIGPRRGRAVRGAPASRAHSTMRRRRGNGGCGCGLLGGATGPCTKRRHGGRRGKGGPIAGLCWVPWRHRQQGERRERVAAALT
jgi:hypothetical protein